MFARLITKPRPSLRMHVSPDVADTHVRSRHLMHAISA
jgi:hypothetical protein